MASVTATWLWSPVPSARTFRNPSAASSAQTSRRTYEISRPRTSCCRSLEESCRIWPSAKRTSSRPAFMPSFVAIVSDRSPTSQDWAESEASERTDSRLRFLSAKILLKVLVSNSFLLLLVRHLLLEAMHLFLVANLVSAVVKPVSTEFFMSGGRTLFVRLCRVRDTVSVSVDGPKPRVLPCLRHQRKRGGTYTYMLLK